MMTSCPVQLNKCKFCVSFISSSQNWVSLCGSLASPWGQQWLGCLITRRHCCAFSQSVPRTSQLGTQARALPALSPALPSGTPPRLLVYIPIYLYDITYLHTFHTWWNMFNWGFFPKPKHSAIPRENLFSKVVWRVFSLDLTFRLLEQSCVTLGRPYLVLTSLPLHKGGTHRQEINALKYPLHPSAQCNYEF